MPESSLPSNDWVYASVPLSPMRQPPRPEVRIGGETFFVEIEDRTVYLRHPVWSLLGAGASLFDAERDLRAEARELVEVMSEMPLRSLDYEALRLYEFVLRVG